MMKVPIDDVADIFDAAIALPPEQRPAYLEQSCRDDERLKQRLKALLDAHDRADRVLLKPPSSSGSSLAHALDIEFPLDVAGTRIGHYTLSRRIAVGGMGIVYEAQQDNPRRSVALKVMKAGIATKSVLRRFEFETQVLGRLQHPNIARIHDAGVHDGELGPVPYFAMELIDNAKTIIDYADEKSLDSTARLQLFIRVCRAVHHGHQKSVIHRDLKPSNVLVDASGEPKIIDFGVARATDSDASLTTMHTDVGKVIGTVAYMSPEQAGGRMDELDTRSDVYSLGVLLFELLSGALPYELEERAILDAVRIIQQDEPAALGSISAALRGDIEIIVAKAIEKEPARRYQSADEFAADIRRYLSNEPIEAHPPTTRYQLSKFARRNRAGVAAAGVIAAVLIAATAVSIGFALNETEQRQLAEQNQAIAEAVNDFLTEDLLAAVAPSADFGKGKDVLMRDVLDEAAERIEEASGVGGRFEEMPLVEASIRSTLGWTYCLLGEYQDAEPHLERARLLRHQELGEEHPETLGSMDRLASFYFAQGRYDEAEPLQVKTLEIKKRVLGEEHPDTLGSMNNLAYLYENQGRYDESEPLYLKTLEGMRRVHGEEHLITLKSMNNLAALYNAQGRYDESEQLIRETLEIKKRVLGEEHPDTLVSMHSLAILHADQGRYDEAEQLIRETLEIQKRLLGEEHPDTLMSMGNLAVVYWSQGRYDEAEPLYVKTLKIKKRVLGEEHPKTLTYIGNLTNLYAIQGRYDEAEPLNVKTLEIRKRVLGEEHRNTLASMGNLASLYLNQARYDEAEPLIRETLEIRKRVLGEEHPDTLMSMRNLAVVYWSQGRYDEAEPLYVKTLKIEKRVRGEEHPETLRTMNNLAKLYGNQGRTDDARPLVRALQVAGRRRADRPGASANDKNALAWDLLTCEPADLRDPETALRLARDACAMTDNANPPILDTLALAQQMTGDNDAAIETQTKAVSLLPPGPSALRSELESNLLKYLLEGQRFAQAEPLLLAMHEQIVGSSDESPAQAQESIERLAEFYESWHAAEQDQGHDAKAAEWRAKLPEEKGE